MLVPEPVNFKPDAKRSALKLALPPNDEVPVSERLPVTERPWLLRIETEPVVAIEPAIVVPRHSGTAKRLVTPYGLITSSVNTVSYCICITS